MNEIITLIAEHGGTLGLAIFAIWMLNRTWELRLQEATRYASELRQLQQQTREALDRNTEAWVRMLQRGMNGGTGAAGIPGGRGG